MTARTPIIALLALSTIMASSAIAGPHRNSGHSSHHRSSHNSHRSHGSGHSGYGSYGYGHSGYRYSSRGYSGYGYYGSRHSGSRYSYGYSSPRYGFSIRYSPSYGYRSSPSYGYGRSDSYSSTLYGSSRRYGSGGTVYSSPSRRAIVASTSTADHDASWDALMYANASLALDRFSDEASAYPRRALPKVGYALASAKLGKLDQAAWAMRRAISYDHKVLTRVPYNDSLSNVLGELASYYENRVEKYHDDGDSWYMLAAVRAMLHDTAGATEAIDYAVQYHADDASKLQSAIAYRN